MSPEQLYYQACEITYAESVRRRGCDERAYLDGVESRRQAVIEDRREQRGEVIAWRAELGVMIAAAVVMGVVVFTVVAFARQ